MGVNMGKKWLLIVWCVAHGGFLPMVQGGDASSPTAEEQYTAKVELPGKDGAEARTYVYRMHPSYCACKGMCMSRDTECTQMCTSCIKAIQNMCVLFGGQTLKEREACQDNAEKDLKGKLTEQNKRFNLSLSFQSQRGGIRNPYHAYRIGKYLAGNYPDYVKCKNICNNIDGKKKPKECLECRTEVCLDNSVCFLSTMKVECRLTCFADLRFYDKKCTFSPVEGCHVARVEFDR
jgi:hypothetical protein